MYEFDESRLEKIATMREEGQEPYPHNLSVTNTAAEAIAMMGDRDGKNSVRTPQRSPLPVG